MSNNGNFGQEHGALSKAAGFVEHARTDLVSRNRTLESQLTPLRTQWQGAGGQAFEQLMMAWNEQNTKIVSALTEFHDKLDSTEKSNTAADQQQHESMAHLKHKLG